MPDRADRNTSQRRAIREVMDRSEHPLSAPEVRARALGHVPGIGLATVYRNIRALFESGFLREVVLPGEPSRYERAALPHHHHFHCTACGRVYDVPGCAEGIAANLKRGFTLRHHELVMYGSCAECS